MGLNLKINRIIFTSLKRRHSNGFLKRIDEEEIKQIAGRAGRYLADGRVACSYLEDLKIVKTALKDMNENLSKTEMKKKIEKKMKKSSKLNLSGDEDEIEDIIGLLEKKPEKQPIFLLKK